MNFKYVKLIERVFLGLFVIALGFYFYHMKVNYIRPYTYVYEGKLQEIKSKRKSILIRLENCETDFYITGYYLLAIQNRKEFLEKMKPGASISFNVISEENEKKNRDVATIKINNIEFSNFESLRHAYQYDRKIGKRISYVIIPIGFLVILGGLLGRYPRLFKQVLSEVQNNNKELFEYEKSKILYYNIRFLNNKVVVYKESISEITFEFDLEKQVFKFLYLKLIPVYLNFRDLSHFGYRYEKSHFEIMIKLNDSEVFSIYKILKYDYINIWDDSHLFIESSKELVIFLNKIISHPNNK